jgi:transposase InsO family protein
LQVKSLVAAQRKSLSRLGTRKLYFKLQPAFRAQGIKVGRDKLFKWMKEFGLLIWPRRRYVQTTMSRHNLRKYPNLIKDLKLETCEQVWVSDITYIKTQEGTCYLNLVTDAYSRRIMGYALEPNMEAASMMKALKMAFRQRLYPENETIHHSDRGKQYCSNKYVALATGNKMKMSMTQDSDPYENALAERMNRTLKEEFGLGKTLKNRQQAETLVKEAVDLYNNHRPHLSLQMKTPQQVHQLKIPAC